MGRLPDNITAALDKRRKDHSLRRLVDHHQLIDFSSNDYLGLSRNSKLAEMIRDNTQALETSGGTGSRLISGNFAYYQEVEDFLAKLFDREAALLYNSGYVANQGVISCLAQKGDTVLYDQLSHVCIKEGAWLSKADSFSYRHNDLDDLESRLAKAKGNIYILTETIFSMDGDIAPLEEIVELSEKYGAHVIIDEAHSTGIYGEAGAGMVVEKELQDRVLAVVYTFGKAIGVHGACVAGDRELIEYLINFSRSFIYTTSMPPHSVRAIQASFEYIEKNPGLGEELKRKVELFKQQMGSDFELISDTAVQPIMIPGNTHCRQLASYLQENGYDVRAILAPTVKEGGERLRISLHVHNTDDDIIGLTQTIKNHLK